MSSSLASLVRWCFSPWVSLSSASACSHPPGSRGDREMGVLDFDMQRLQAGEVACAGVDWK